MIKLWLTSYFLIKIYLFSIPTSNLLRSSWPVYCTYTLATRNKPCYMENCIHLPTRLYKIPSCTKKNPFEQEINFVCQGMEIPTLLLVGPSLKTVGDVADIASSRTHGVGEVALVDGARVVETQSTINGRRSVLIIELLQISLEMLRASHDHRRDLFLHNSS